MNRRAFLRELAIRGFLKKDAAAREVVPRIYIGSIGSAYSRDSLTASGITHVLCVAANIEPKHSDIVAHMCISVRDAPEEKLIDRFDECFAFIDDALSASPTHRVLVHCFQGKSRSATVVTAYLMRSRAIDFSASLALLREVRPAAQPNLGFAMQLRRFEREESAARMCALGSGSASLRPATGHDTAQLLDGVGGSAPPQT
jgi:atypical dual specificity phosphatase